MIAAIRRFVPQRVKQKLQEVWSRQSIVLPHGSRVLFFLAADYGNIGDIAISAAQQGFISKVLPGHTLVPVPISRTRLVLHSVRRQVTPSDLIAITGGGNMGSLYPDIEDLRQLVIRSFPNNRVVCFPQTLDWDESSQSRKALQKIHRVYARHPDIHVFARESISFQKLRSLFVAAPSVKVGLVPDIVLSSAAVSLGGRGATMPTGALLCLRDDRERALDSSQHRALDQALKEAGLAVQITDTHAGGACLSKELCGELLAEKITQFQGAQLVITDRLHGMILAALAGTPCLVLANTNHKIRQTWQDWLRELPRIRFVESGELPNIGEEVRHMLAMPRTLTASPCVDPSHYDALRRALTSHE